MAKKHILKPGIHQFAPGGNAVHNNDNLTDEDAEWYLDKYPHIAALFETNTTAAQTKKTKLNQPVVITFLPEEFKAAADDGLTQ